ncbi:hypothetical protein EMIT0P176_120022 [Pseudomonas sp. IT-P176]
MDRKCSVFIAASVDGFIARIDGDIEWLHRPEYECAALKGLSYDEFMTTVDAIVMGRKTLDKVLSFPQWPYDNTPVVVLSHGEVALPQELRGKVDVLAGDPVHIVEQLAARGLKHLYIDGADHPGFPCCGIDQRDCHHAHSSVVGQRHSTVQPVC